MRQNYNGNFANTCGGLVSQRCGHRESSVSGTTGSELASLLLGWKRQLAFPSNATLCTRYAGYIQDDFKVVR
jgi:hypothetical protein